MSFMLQFFHAPHVDSVDSAAHYVDGECDADPPLGERFAQFVDRVTTVYPDLSAEDDDGDDLRNLWPEGLDRHWGDEPVVNVGLKTDAVEEGVLSIIASKAAQSGLQMLDPQNAMLYRTDHTVIDGRGRVSPFRMLTPFAASLMKPLSGGLKPGETRHRLGESLRDRLASAGFALTIVESDVVVWRQLGDIRQALDLTVSEREDGIAVDLSLWLSSPRLSSTWLAVMPPHVAEWKQRGDRLCGGVAWDFVYALSDVVPGTSAEEAGRFDSARLSSPDALEAFQADLCNYAAARLLPWLDGLRDLSALAALVLSDANIEYAGRGRVALPEQMGTLVLARLARPEVFETVAHTLQTNPHKSRVWEELRDPEGRLLDRLVDHLRATPPD